MNFFHILFFFILVISHVRYYSVEALSSPFKPPPTPKKKKKKEYKCLNIVIAVQTPRKQ